MHSPREILAQFPLLSERKRAGSFAYLDNAATTQKPAVVLDSLQKFYVAQNSNVHRGLYDLAEVATEEFERAREGIAHYLRWPTGSVVFTAGATAGLNMLALGLEREVGSDDTILVTELEHHSNILPWMRLAKRTGARLAWVPVRDDGSLDFERFTELLRRHRVRIFAVSGLSHVLGNITPVEFLFAEAARHGALTVLDASQSVRHADLVRSVAHVDALVFSGHKVFGPTGVGVVALSERLERVLEPVFLGGGMVSEVTKLDATWLEAPACFEGGTPPVAEAIALAEALRFNARFEVDEVASHESDLVERLARGLAADADVTLHGWARALAEGHEVPAHGGILSFTVRGGHPHDLAQDFADAGLAVRAGAHCAQPLMERLKVPGTLRVSVAPYNSSDEIDFLLDVFRRRQKLSAPAWSASP